MIPPKPGFRTSQRGFTLVELIMIIVILGVLAAISLPSFADFSDDAHTSVARSTSEEFRSGINMVRFSWLAQGSVGGSVGPVQVNNLGWATGNPSFNNGSCATLVNNIFSQAPTMLTTFVPGTEGWLPLGFGSFCFYIYMTDTAPLRFFRYNSTSGTVDYF